MRLVTNKTFQEIAVGDTASLERTLQLGDVQAWAAAFDEWDVFSAAGESQVAAGIVTALLTSLVGSNLPGPGSVVQSVSVHILGALPIGAALTVELLVYEKRAGKGVVLLNGKCTTLMGDVIATATLEVLAPTTRQQHTFAAHRLDGLLERCKDLSPMITGVVYPCSPDALSGAIAATEAGLIEPVLYGPKTQILNLAKQANFSINQYRIVNTESAEDAALKAALAAGRGELAALMKGSLHTNVFLHPILQKENNLRSASLLSHCTLISVPTYPRRIIVSDVALNIAPDTNQKRDICQNAINFARALGIGTPKVAILAAVEMVNTHMPSTLDAAILSKMADRGQIVGGMVDGPLDLDAAVDANAARIKHIESPIAGQADILIVPNIEAGNLVYKNLAFMANAQIAGLVIGARVPVILTSRADTIAARCFSAAAAVLYADALTRDPTILSPAMLD